MNERDWPIGMRSWFIDYEFDRYDRQVYRIHVIGTVPYNGIESRSFDIISDAFDAAIKFGLKEEKCILGYQLVDTCEVSLWWCLPQPAMLVGTQVQKGYIVRRTQSQAVINRLDGTVYHRVVFGARMFKKCYMGFIRKDNLIERVYMKGVDWYEHPTDWRFYDTITDARKYDEMYDVDWDEEGERLGF